MTDFFSDSTPGIYSETITSAGTYSITADGAQGGDGVAQTSPTGGLGATVSGDIYLNMGTVLEIVVGGEGVAGGGDLTGDGGGGGGGSFVFEGGHTDIALDTILAIAGGGGGGGFQGGGGGGMAGPTGGHGMGISAGSGGLHGAAGGAGGPGGGGGGGYTGGTGSTNGGGSAGNGTTIGNTFLGGTGGTGGNGGLGGGGAGGTSGGGGGGGYGGGGGGGNTLGQGGAGGGGGGSNDSALTGAVATADTHSGDGFVSIDEVSCFLEGTRIETPLGGRAVETLGKGDLVTTADGGSAPVRWIGRRTLRADGENGYRFADPLIYLPVRIRAGALGDTLPVRDLLVSMDHAVLIDGLLVQAGALVNGVSVIRETRLPECFTYYHIELSDHALVLAEGVPAETFVDNVTRLGFDNWAEHEALYGNELSIAEMPYPRVQSHRQLPVEIRAEIDDRARQLSATPRGWLTA